MPDYIKLPSFARKLPDERIELRPTASAVVGVPGLERSSMALCAALLTLAATGIPAWIALAFWQMLQIGMVPGLTGIAPASVFLLFYIAGFGLVLPPIVALLCLLGGHRLVPHFGVRLVISEQGIGLIGTNRFIDWCIGIGHMPGGIVAWKQLKFMACGRPNKAWVTENDLDKEIKGLVYFTSMAGTSGLGYLTLGRQPRRTGYRRPLHIPLAAFSPEQRQQLLNGILRWKGDVKVAPEVYTALGARAAAHIDDRYTKLWLKLLEASGGAADNCADVLSVGEDVGPFQVTERLETGGQANVYRAAVIDAHCEDCQVPTGVEEVVLKEFILSGVDASARILSGADFENECLLLSRFKSPNIVRLYDMFVQERRAYLVLESIDGTSVRRIVDRDGALSAPQAINIAIGICDALHELHTQSTPLVHRDVSPENILCPDIKLIDFSLTVPASTELTEQVVGKQSYISPGQFRGEIDPRNDIYALGATMFFMLTAEEPEPICQQDLAAALKENPAPQLDRIVARCTALDADSRYQSVSELREDLVLTLDSLTAAVNET